ncbi:MAG TPA: glycosyltransferase, partial [Burkholderiaceae bacterium]|nr:glycosyltransferase [Burkholderiaceae bacterium]
DASTIASREEAEKSWQDKLAGTAPRLKLLFAGRVTAAKGVSTLLEAIQSLDAAGQAVDLHIIGHGDLIEACKETQKGLKHAQLEMIEPLSYGPEFFRFLRGYHAVVVPSITDEQPRIVYDAYSKGVPVIASNTDGLRDCVEDKVTGWLCRPNDAGDLARLLTQAASHPDQLAAMMPACLARARQMTHQQMHHKRLELLNRYLLAWRQAAAH